MSSARVVQSVACRFYKLVRIPAWAIGRNWFSRIPQANCLCRNSNQGPADYSFIALPSWKSKSILEIVVLCRGKPRFISKRLITLLLFEETRLSLMKCQNLQHLFIFFRVAKEPHEHLRRILQASYPMLCGPNSACNFHLTWKDMESAAKGWIANLISDASTFLRYFIVRPRCRYLKFRKNRRSVKHSCGTVVRAMQ